MLSCVASVIVAFEFLWAWLKIVRYLRHQKKRACDQLSIGVNRMKIFQSVPEIKVGGCSFCNPHRLRNQKSPAIGGLSKITDRALNGHNTRTYKQNKVSLSQLSLSMFNDQMYNSVHFSVLSALYCCSMVKARLLFI